jgi:hypothetical protein
MIPVEKHIEDIIALIPKHAIFSFKDIFVYYKGCTRQWAYELNIDKNDTIKGLIYDNKRKGVSSLLSKWVTSSNPTLQISAMKILSDDDERMKLSMNHQVTEIYEKPIFNGIDLNVEENDSTREDS